MPGELRRLTTCFAAPSLPRQPRVWTNGLRGSAKFAQTLNGSSSVTGISSAHGEPFSIGPFEDRHGVLA